MIKNKSFVIRNDLQNVKNISQTQPQNSSTQPSNTRKTVDEIVTDFNDKIHNLLQNFNSQMDLNKSEHSTLESILTTHSSQIQELEAQIVELSTNFKMIGELIKQLLLQRSQ